MIFLGYINIFKAYLIFVSEPVNLRILDIIRPSQNIEWSKLI